MSRFHTKFICGSVALTVLASAGFAQSDLASRLKALHDGTSAGVDGKTAQSAAPSIGTLPKFSPMSAADASAAPHIRLVQGMLIVSAVTDSVSGDYEVLRKATSVDDRGVRIQYSSQSPDSESGGQKGPVKRAHGSKFDHQNDLLHATGAVNYFSSVFPEEIPGTTSARLSVDLMSQLRTTGKTEVTTIKGGGIEGQLGMFAAALGDPRGFWDRVPKVQCVLTRVEAQDIAYPVLLDGKRVYLPAIHASCVNQAFSHAYVYDQLELPLFLAAVSSEQQLKSQITEIHYPPAPVEPINRPAKAPHGQDIEKSLKEKGRVDVYGIYFDFDRDVLRPESEPVLRQIADAMNANPTWRLFVNGHTDNVGGDAHNLDLSNRRAAAVKQALVAQYRIDPSRLTPQGYGAKQPKESNDTMEGRARNRRVELVKQ
jgi:outer membrane protein OmpA-like peptidoglycan-associated protein